MRTRGGIAFGYGVDVKGARKQIDLDTGKTGYTQSRNDITNKIPNAGFWTHKATADEDHGENTLSPMKTRGGKAFGHGLRPEDVQKPSDIDATLDTNLIHLDLLVDYSAWTEYETVIGIYSASQDILLIVFVGIYHRLPDKRSIFR